MDYTLMKLSVNEWNTEIEEKLTPKPKAEVAIIIWRFEDCFEATFIHFFLDSVSKPPW